MELVRRHFDPVLASACAVVITLEVLAYDGASAAAVPLAAASGLALAARRRAPLAAFVLTVLLLRALIELTPDFDNDSIGLVAVFYVAHYSLGRWARGTEVWLAIPCVAASIVAFVVDDTSWQWDLGDVGFAVAFVGGPWAAGLIVRLRRERETALREENARLEAEQAEVARRAVIEERSRIARELHDVVSHAISVSVLQARGARQLLGKDDETVLGALDAIERTNTAALGDMRRLLAVLRDTEDYGPEISRHRSRRCATWTR